MTSLKIGYKQVSEIIPYVRNSRTHSEDQITQVASSIKEFGFTNPILIDGNNGIIAGHGRLLAAKKLGLDSVPTIDLSHLSSAQQKAYVIADNQLALNAGWDAELLSLEVQELDELGFDLTLMGFDDSELAAFLHPEQVDGLTDDDAVPVVPEKPATVLGDIWTLGNHKVMCGDSTSVDSVERLMGGHKTDMIFTDPPYGMSYGGGRAAGSSEKGDKLKAHGMILGDDLRGDGLIEMIAESISSATLSSKEGSALYVCFPWRTYSEFESALTGIGLKVAACIVWDKKSIGLGNSNYRPQHEFIFYIKGGAWHGDKAQSDIWSMSRGATAAYVHPTQKPVELIEKAIENSSKTGDLVHDCFGGSGSTLIACEKTNRNAYLMELDPKYVDVIIQRWQEYTGKEALHENGQSFNDITISKNINIEEVND